MITEFIQELIDATGLPVYAGVVPATAVYPCIRYQIVFTDPYQTKDGSSVSKRSFKVDIYAKDNTATESAYQIAYDYGELVKTELNAKIVSSTEYRVQDLTTNYEDSTELHYCTLDIDIQYNE